MARAAAIGVPSSDQPANAPDGAPGWSFLRTSDAAVIVISADLMFESRTAGVQAILAQFI